MPNKDTDDIMSAIQETIELPVTSESWLSRNAAAIVGVESLMAAILLVWAIRERTDKKKALREVRALAEQAAYLKELSENLRADAQRAAEINSRNAELLTAVQALEVAAQNLENTSNVAAEYRDAQDSHANALEFILLGQFIIMQAALNPQNANLTQAKQEFFDALRRVAPGRQVSVREGSGPLLAVEFLSTLEDMENLNQYPGMAAQIEDLAAWLSEVPEDDFADSINNILYMSSRQGEPRLSYVGQTITELGR